MMQHKLIFSGPVGAGKTTAITAISDIPPVVTDVRADAESDPDKRTTTVAMDYGVLRLGEEERVHLYGTPGQERFDFMWEILSEGAIGIVLLMTTRRQDPVGDLRFFLDAFRPLIERTQLAVGVTGVDVMPEPGLPAFQRALAAAGMSAPLFEIDARRRHEVAMLIQALLLSEDPALAGGTDLLIRVPETRVG
jgi:signal recognition particle receptor subunit beta